jgi:hypothetical protein
LRRFTRRLGCANAPLFGRFRLLRVTPLCEHHQLLLNSRNLRLGLLPLLSKGFELLVRGRGLARLIHDGHLFGLAGVA